MTRQDVARALDALREGSFVLVYDSDKRERETDFVIASQFVSSDAIRRMRRDGGGLICTTVHPEAWKRLGIPFLSDLFCEARQRYPLLGELIPNDIPYDTKSAFAITINHRKTYTGVTDHDRSLTVSEFSGMVREALAAASGETALRKSFGKLFRAPGHVTLLNAAEGLLSKRSGHTEMATALVSLAGLIPSATICEMMGDDGKARPKEDAARYARANNFIFIEGADVKAFWETAQKGAARPQDGSRTGVCANGR